jgi:hypothetical protein
MAKKRKSSSYERLRKTPMSLYLEPAQYERLKKASAISLAPMQAILREGLELILTTKYEAER